MNLGGNQERQEAEKVKESGETKTIPTKNQVLRGALGVQGANCNVGHTFLQKDRRTKNVIRIINEKQ